MLTLKVGIIGLGTVGTGVAKILLNSNEDIYLKTNCKLELAKVVDIDTSNKDKLDLDDNVFSTDINDILDNPEIDIVVELIGGLNPAKDFIVKALQNGKHVVTANKHLLAKHSPELINIATENSKGLYFEAAVAGGIPVLKALKESLIANTITGIYGIINGTTNYILTSMSKKGSGFAETLKKAQKLGFAEADPTNDIEGYDAAHKLTVLATLAYGIPVKFDDVYCEGVTKIKSVDLKFAHQLGYEIKLLAIAKKFDNCLDLRVHPTLIPFQSILANTLYENNAIYLVGNNVGPVMLFGKGAGELPTASAVLGDICDIAVKTNENYNFSDYNFYYADKPLKIIPKFTLKTSYYIRLTTVDKPYVLSNISKILSDNNISIKSLIQTEHSSDGNAIIVIMTHAAIEKSIGKAIEEIDKLSVVTDETMVIRTEKFE